MTSVSAEWRGLWRRLAIETPDGGGDTETLVLWLQTATFYADIRIPAGGPDLSGVSGFADLPAEGAAFLARQEGFAGRLHAAPPDARWDRTIDFSPLAGPPDEGRLARAGRMMVEHGRHVAYTEHWWQDTPETAGDTEVLVDEPRRIAVRAGPVLMLAQERRPAPPPRGALARLVAAAAPDDWPALLDCEISLAHREGTEWRIAHSTLPWREGAALSL